MRKLIAILIMIVLVAAAVPAFAHDHMNDNLSGACAVSRGATLSPGVIRGFDPQPEPPAMVNNLPSNGLEKVGFNPQPDPPRDPFRLNTQLCDGSV